MKGAEVRQRPGDPPLRLHVIRFLIERAVFLNGRSPGPGPASHDHSDDLADVLPFREPPSRGANPASLPRPGIAPGTPHPADPKFRERLSHRWSRQAAKSLEE
jgi:hypothetical protein